MFCYQRNFGCPTEIVSQQQFWALIKAPRTVDLVREAREALALGDKKTYDAKKKRLPFVIFIATYIETVSASGKLGCWRKQAACRLNGLCVIDFDHINGDVREVWAEAYSLLSDEDKARVLLVYITPSGHGLKVVFIADPQYNLIDNRRFLQRSSEARSSV